MQLQFPLQTHRKLAMFEPSSEAKIQTVLPSATQAKLKPVNPWAMKTKATALKQALMTQHFLTAL